MSRKKQGGGKRRRALGHEEPFRTCVACRTSAPRQEMLRFARGPDGAVAFDVRARLDGRGAWTCAKAACIEKARTRGGFERAFEEPVIFDGDLVARVREILSAEILLGLGLVRRAGALVAGRDEVARTVDRTAERMAERTAERTGEGAAETKAARGPTDVLVLASDLSARSRNDVKDLAAVTIAGPSMADIGAAIGRKPTGVLLLKSTPRGQQLIDDLRRAERLAEPNVHA